MTSLMPGWCSSTPEKITDSNTSDIYIWKLVMPAARAASATFGASFVKSRRTPLPIVWKCTGSPEAATASHIGFHHGSHNGVMSPRREISSPRTPPRRATRSISPAAAPMSWFGMKGGPAKQRGAPLVIDAQHLAGGFVVVDAAGGAEDAIENFGLDAVAVLVFQSQFGI